MCQGVPGPWRSIFTSIFNPGDRSVEATLAGGFVTAFPSEELCRHRALCKSPYETCDPEA